VRQSLSYSASQRIVDEVHEIRRTAVDWNVKGAVPGARAPQHWLIIAGQQPMALVVKHPVGREQALKKLTSLPGPPLSAFSVLELARQIGRAFRKELLGFQERSQRSRMIVAFPTGKIGKLNGLEDNRGAGHGSSNHMLIWRKTDLPDNNGLPVIE
jgi:hypothetical protein